VRARNPRSARIAGLRVLALGLAGATDESSKETAAACDARPSPVLDAETCAWIRRTFPSAP